jgi:hypothetical protein
LYLAHRVAWTLTAGSDPGSMFVCHRCDAPPCCNPAHLFLGDQTANMADMIAKGREDHSLVLRGADNGHAKLTDAHVVEIWRLHLHEGLGERLLGAQFGVTPANIHMILSGQTWKHLIPPDRTYLKRPKTGRPRKPIP